MATGVRPGSEKDTGAEKQAYGATTLLARHVQVSPTGAVRLKFTGKKGVALDIPVNDPGVAHMLRARAAKGGRLFDTTDVGLRGYAAGLAGGGYKPKDFRTLRGTLTAAAEVKARNTPRGPADYKRAVRDVATVVAAKLGNTPTVALQSYIDPTVFAKWRPAA
jgi:DNA topoisomerase-1